MQDIYDMQVKNENSQSRMIGDTTLLTATQNKPSLTILEENLRTRLERFSFSAHTPLERFHEGGGKFNAHNTESIANHLEVTILELRYLINDLYWLQWIKAKKGMA